MRVRQFKSNFPSFALGVGPPPRIPVASEGLGWDPATENRAILMVTLF